MCIRDRNTLVPPALLLRLARQYERAGRPDRAGTTLALLHSPAAGGVQDWSVANAALVAHAELAVKLGRKQEAVSLWSRAAAHGDAQYQGIVKQGLARAQALPD